MLAKTLVVGALAVCAAAQDLPWPLGTVLKIAPSTNSSGLGIRHCNWLSSVTPPDTGDKALDFYWRLMPPIDGTPGGVSLVSANYDGYYLSPLVSYDNQKGRLGPVFNCGGWSDCTFMIAANGDGTYKIQRQGGGGSYKGTYVSQSTANSGSCSFPSPSGDLMLLAQGNPSAVTQDWVITPAPALPPPNPATVTIDVSSVDHVVSDKYLGCHVDPGWTHQPLSWHSNMIYGQSFEAGAPQTPPLKYAWWNASDASVAGTAALDPSTRVNPTLAAPALKLAYSSGTGFLGWGNRGIGSEGLSWAAAQPYEGFAWVLAPSGATFEVRMQDRTHTVTTASQTVTVPASSTWQRFNFSLTPSSAAQCTGIAPGADPDISCTSLGPNPGQMCVRCDGEFQIGLTAPGTAWVGFVQLEPGAWGRFAGLSVQKATVDAMQQMGVSVIRQGGTVSQGFRWKDWRGAPWARPSMQHTWGTSLVAPWGPFEFLDVCAAANIESVLTFAQDLNSPQDWADLIEYAWGNESTTWGAVRVYNDSHPQPYQITTLELGNEQYNPNYVAQVTAMEAKRSEIGAPAVYYMFPENGGYSASMAQQLASLGGDELIRRTMPDCHVGEGGGIDCATSDFAALPGYNISFINAEVNAQHSDIRRAITEASDLQAWFNAPASVASRLRARTASFCTERSGHFDGFDQGLTFFLPNMTWLQPPGHVHAMIKDVLGQATGGLRVTVDQAGPPNVLTSSAQLSNDGSSIFIQLANNWNSPSPANVTVTLTGTGSSTFVPAGQVLVTWVATPEVDATGSPWEFSGNTPAQPGLIAPQGTTLYWPGGSDSMTLQLAPYSFTLLQVLAAQ